MKNFYFAALFLIALSFSAGSFAQSAKATASVGDVSILDTDQMGWTTIMSQKIKTANAKDLVMDVALECGLYSKTVVRSQKGQKDTATAESAVRVRVLVDGKEAKPGHVTFCERQQELSATLGGILEECTDSNGDGKIVLDECTFTDEEVSLMLKTMNANSFNFILDNMLSGTHNIQVQAQIQSKTEAGQGSASANASIGKGAIVIEEVRMVKDEVIDF